VNGIHYRDLVKILHTRKSYSVDGGSKSERERDRENKGKQKQITLA